MGASTFCDFYQAEGSDDTAKSAFDRAVEEAQYDHGHSGYTGTIAEKHKFRTLASVTTKEQGLAKAEEMLDEDDSRISDKWGPAGCIEVENPKGWIFFGIASS